MKYKVRQPIRAPSTIYKVVTWPFRFIAKAFNLLTLHTSSWFIGLTASWAESGSYETLADHGLRNPYVFRCRALIGSAMGHIPLIANFSDMEDGEEVLQEDPDHIFLRVLERPNQDQSWQAFIQEIYDHLLFGGEIFLHAPESPLTGPNRGLPTPESGLRLIRPDRVQYINRNENDDIVSYQWINRMGQSIETPAVRIHHLRLITDPRTAGGRERLAGSGVGVASGYEDRGWPLLLSCWRQVQLMEDGDSWNLSIAQNRGRIPGFFKYTGEGVFDDTQFRLTKENIQSAWRSDTEASMPSLLAGDYDFIPGATTAKDADFLQGDIRAARKIASALGVPFRLIDDEKSSTLTDAGIDSEMKALLTLTVLPLLGWLLGEFNHRYVRRYDPDQPREIVPNLDQVPALQEDQTDRYKRFGLGIADSIITPNEARHELGWDAVEDEAADILYVPFNRVPLSTVGMEVNGTGEEPLDLSMPLDAYVVKLLRDAGLKTNGHA